MPRSRSSLIGGAPIPDYGLLDVPRRRRGKQRAVRGEEAELVADFHVAAPDQDTSLGRRDHALLRLAVLTGVRVTELVTLTIGDVNLTNGAHIKIKGKGRKRRATTLTPETVTVLRACLTERQGQPHAPLFPTRQGQPLTRSGVRQLLSKHTNTATTTCPSLNDKPVSPHTLRHTNAMLLRAGEIDITTIALRLGQHESIKTTYIYRTPIPPSNKKAIDRIAPIGTKPGRYRPSDALLAFLQRPLIMRCAGPAPRRKVPSSCQRRQCCMALSVTDSKARGGAFPVLDRRRRGRRSPRGEAAVAGVGGTGVLPGRGGVGAKMILLPSRDQPRGQKYKTGSGRLSLTWIVSCLQRLRELSWAGFGCPPPRCRFCSLVGA